VHDGAETARNRHELFVRVAPSSASVLATGGAMEGDLTGLASVNRCLYKFTHGHGYGGGARGSGATGPQSGHADVDVEHQDIAACVLGAPSPFLTTIFSCDPTAARRVDVLVTSEDRVVRLEDCVAGAVPDGARWMTFVLSVGDSVTFHSSALHGGGCNHAPDGAFDQVAGHAYWPGRPIRVVADSSWTVVAGVGAEAMAGMPQRKAGCRTCVALEEQQWRIKPRVSAPACRSRRINTPLAEDQSTEENQDDDIPEDDGQNGFCRGCGIATHTGV